MVRRCRRSSDWCEPVQDAGIGLRRMSRGSSRCRLKPATTFLFVFLAVTPAISAQAPAIALEPIADGLNQPLFLTNGRDGRNRRFIVEQVGRIRVLQPGSSAPALFLDINSRV